MSQFTMIVPTKTFIPGGTGATLSLTSGSAKKIMHAVHDTVCFKDRENDVRDFMEKTRVGGQLQLTSGHFSIVIFRSE